MGNSFITSSNIINKTKKIGLKFFTGELNEKTSLTKPVLPSTLGYTPDAFLVPENRGDGKKFLISTKRPSDEAFSVSLDLVVNGVVGRPQQSHHLLLRVLEGPAVLGHLQRFPLCLEGL
jgi:hypothetical protein